MKNLNQLVVRGIEFLAKCDEGMLNEEDYILGTGCERIAYDLGDNLVLKIRKDLMLGNKDAEYAESHERVWDYCEMNQTEAEVKMWEGFLDHQKTLFNPILASGKYLGDVFTIVPKMIAFGRDIEDRITNAIEYCEFNEINFDFEELDRIACKYDLDYCDMTSNLDNFGLNVNGDFVISDFGL